MPRGSKQIGSSVFPLAFAREPRLSVEETARLSWADFSDSKAGTFFGGGSCGGVVTNPAFGGRGERGR